MKRIILLFILSLFALSVFSMQIVITEKDGSVIYDVEGNKTDQFDAFLKNIESSATLSKSSFGDDFLVRCFFVCNIELNKINGISAVLKQYGIDHQTILAAKSPYVPSTQIIFTVGKPTEFELRPRIYVPFKERKSNQQVEPIVTTPVDKVEAQSTQAHP